MGGRKVWFDVVEQAGGPIGAGRDIVSGAVMDREVS
jgi:hypothetical protein